mmetsp:Transcript_54691/g.127929  ORF Transcript_54691/g.127929 Transcript_54691/m.127929 type:complete len:1814 (+) Transcript_54691:119-5560(+)
MSKWVAKKDDVGVSIATSRTTGKQPVGGGATDGGMLAAAAVAAQNRISEARRQQTGEIRRQIREAAKEARGEAGTRRDGEPGAVGTGQPGLFAPAVEALLGQARVEEKRRTEEPAEGGKPRKKKAEAKGQAAATAGGAATGPGTSQADKKKKSPRGDYQEWDEGAYWSEWGDASSLGQGTWKGGGWGQEWNAADWGYGGQDEWGQDWGGAWDSSWADGASEWDEYISEQKDGTVKVDLAGAELGDQDLRALVQYLDSYMAKHVEQTQEGHYGLSIDLSCNTYISDGGVEAHLAPFLHKWPNCHRLKLSKNSIGDGAIKALTSWVSEGHVHELHMFDLSGKVTSDGVASLLKEVQKKGRYPYTNNKRERCPLWLRLEHNSIPDVEALLAKVKGLNYCILEKADLGKVRPGHTHVKPETKEVPGINLVQFRMQDRMKRGAAQNAATAANNMPRGADPRTQNANSKKKEDKKAQNEVANEGDANGEADAERALWEPHKDGKDGAGKDKPRGSGKLSINDLQMGCASYKTASQRSTPAGAPTNMSAVVAGTATSKAAKAQRQPDIRSSKAFPSLGTDTAETKAPAGSWGVPNIHAAVAWGAAPSAVFDAKAKPKPKPAGVPILPPPPQTQGHEPTGPPAEKGREAAPVSVLAESEPSLSAQAEESVPDAGAEHYQQQVEWRPLSFAEKNLLKVKKKLRDIEKLEEAIAAGDHKIESNQLAKVQRKDALLQELQTLESRSRAQGGRTLIELEKAEKLRREQEEGKEAAEEAEMSQPIQEENQEAEAVQEEEEDEEEEEEDEEYEEDEDEAEVEQPEPVAQAKIQPEPIKKEAEVAPQIEPQPYSLTEACWEYLDPQGKTQGPFDGTRMAAWYAREMLPQELGVRYDKNMPFFPIHMLFRHPYQPFRCKPPSPLQAPDTHHTTPPPVAEATPQASPPPSQPPVQAPVQKPQQSQPPAASLPKPNNLAKVIQQPPQQPPPQVPLQPPQHPPQQPPQTQTLPPTQSPKPQPAQPLAPQPVQQPPPPAQPPKQPPRQPPSPSASPVAKAGLMNLPAQPPQPPPSTPTHQLEGQTHRILQKAPQQPPPAQPPSPAPQQPPQVPPATRFSMPPAPSGAAPPPPGAPPAMDGLPRHPTGPPPAPKAEPGNFASPKAEPKLAPPQVAAPPPPKQIAPAPAPEPPVPEDTHKKQTDHAANGSRPSAAEAVPPPKAVPNVPPVEKAAPPAPAPKVDGQADAFARFFRRVGTTPEQLEQEKAELEKELKRKEEKERAEREKAKEKELEMEKEKEREKERELELLKEREREEELQKERELERQKAKEEEERAQEEKGSEEGQEHEAKANGASKSLEEKESKENGEGVKEAKASPMLGFSLPPRGTITKKGGEVEAPKAPTVAPPAPPPPAAKAKKEEDEAERVQEVSPLDHRFVGLVIGKQGETIKSFKKTSGASIEIDQNLPEGMPRAVLYRGTRKEVNMAKKLVESLVQRAKEDEKAKASSQPMGAGQGILGRGPSGSADDIKPVEEAKGDAARPGDAGPARETNVPPWRCSKGEEEKPAAGEGRKPPTTRRDTPWTTRKEKEPEAAPAGSLTGSLLSATPTASMRPAWMNKPKASGETAEEAAPSYQDKSVWNENKYSRSLFLQAKLKMLKKKAYEVPEAMMTMTTGPRPEEEKEKEKEKKGKKDKGGGGGGDDHKDDATHHAVEDGAHNNGAGIEEEVPRGTTSKALSAGADDQAAAEGRPDEDGAAKKAKQKSSSAVPESYINRFGDSKDILKLKKKLREIQKIEDAIAAKETVEPLQADKVHKKEQYLEELRVLEAIVHSGTDD